MNKIGDLGKKLMDRTKIESEQAMSNSIHNSTHGSVSLSQTYVESLLSGDRVMSRLVIDKALATGSEPVELLNNLVWPTMELLQESAKTADKSIEIRTLLVDGAWAHFLSGNQAISITHGFIDQGVHRTWELSPRRAEGAPSAKRGNERARSIPLAAVRGRENKVSGSPIMPEATHERPRF